MDFVESLVMKRQVEKMKAADIEEYKKVKRDIRFDGKNREPHKLQGFGSQGILKGAYARDFRPNEDVRGAWRVIYDYEDENTVNIYAILDYHGGFKAAPLYLLQGETIDLD